MKKILLVIGVFVIFVLLDIFLGEHTKEFPWSGIPSFFSLIGLVGALLLFGFSELLGHYWLLRGEDYYERDDDAK